MTATDLRQEFDLVVVHPSTALRLTSTVRAALDPLQFASFEITSARWSPMIYAADGRPIAWQVDVSGWGTP